MTYIADRNRSDGAPDPAAAAWFAEQDAGAIQSPRPREAGPACPGLLTDGDRTLENDLSRLIAQISAECRDVRGALLSPVGIYPTQQQIEDFEAAVFEQCDRLDELALRARTEVITRDEFEGALAELRRLHAHPTYETYVAVQRAFAAAGP